MKKPVNYLYIFFAIPVIIFFASCAGYQNYTGENLVINAGDTASVNYSADTFHGYEWVVTSNSDPAVAKYLNVTNIPETGNNTDPVKQVIKFKGLKKGKTIVTLNYIKNGEMIAKKTRTVNITVY